HHFGVGAGALDARQSALLAAVIINPRRFDPAHPNRRIERRARMILGRMSRRGFITENEYRIATGQEPLPSPVDSPALGAPDSTLTPETDSAPPDTLPAVADS